MACCNLMNQAMDREFIVQSEPHLIHDGRVLNEVDTEFFIRSEESSGIAGYLGVNFCPFCGRAISKGLWAAEKKKSGDI